MKNQKTFRCALGLALVLGISVVAVGQAPTSCEPGQILTPPCAAASYTQTTPERSADLGQAQTPPASNAVDMLSVAEAAVNVLQIMLSLF